MEGSHYSIWLTQPKAISFVCISVFLMFLIGCYYLSSFLINKYILKITFKKQPLSNKAMKLLKIFFKTSYANYLALAFAIIMGLIYSSLKNYENLAFNSANPHNEVFLKNQLWVWQAISFNYTVGSWIVTFLFFTLLILLPAVSYVSLRNFLSEKLSWSLQLKKLSWILLMCIATLAIFCLFYVIPVIGKDTSLSVFSLSKTNLAIGYQDHFYYSSKWVHENIFLTFWYPLFFICYLVLNFSVFGLIAYLEVFKNKNILINKKFTKMIFHKAENNRVLTSFGLNNLVFRGLIQPYHFFDTLSSVELYAFMTAFMLFNLKEPFVHIGSIMLLMIICFSCFMVAVFIYGSIKHKNNFKAYLNSYFNLVKINFYNNKKQKEIDVIENDVLKKQFTNHNFGSFKITHTIIVGIGFTIFLGFTNLTTFNSFDQIGNTGWKDNMWQPYFWLSTGVTGFLATYLLIGASNQTSLAKNMVGSGGYSIMPGMQTGTLGFLGTWLAKSSNMIDAQIKLVI